MDRLVLRQTPRLLKKQRRWMSCEACLFTAALLPSPCCAELCSDNLRNKFNLLIIHLPFDEHTWFVVMTI